jgi:TRAP-type mannitol/chloroaromatic compound transport system substrate-binding protein
MDRRSFIKKAGIAAGGATAAAAFPMPAISQGMQELKMVTTWPKNFPGLGTGAQRVCDRIGAMTDGRITVKLYAAGELVGPFESFDAVSTGTADMYHGAEYYWQGKHKAFNFFTAVPLGLTGPELNGWINFGGGQALWDELSSGFNIKPFMAGNTGVQMGGWFRSEVNSLEDFKGINFRMPGLGGEVLRRIGANVVALPGGDIFPALQAGTIDATEWVGPWNDLAFGFYKVAKFYYYPGFHEPGSGLSVGINMDVWNKFSDADKAIFEAACRAENSYMYSEFMANNGAALDTLIHAHGVQLRRFSDEIFDAFGKTSEEVVAEVAAGDDLGKRVYNSYIQARKNIGGWTRLSEQTYTLARDQVLGT